MDFKFVLAFVYCAVIPISSGERVCCGDVGCFNNSFPYEHMPLPECSVVDETKFFLFTRENPKKGVAISHDSIPSELLKGKPVVFLAHGMFCDSLHPWILQGTAALLQAYDVNVVALEWGGASFDIRYHQISSNSRVVGAVTARLARALMEDQGISPLIQWCVGHSLGAYICSYLGKRFKIGRITGLEPAGPFHECYDSAAHLNRNDADFVDVIHTNGKDSLILDLGTMKPMGHIDFYPNDGGVQPGCYNRRKRSLPSRSDSQNCLQIIRPEDLIGWVACSHGVSLEIWLESFKCEFQAQRECTDALQIPTSCMPCTDDCPLLGPNAIHASRRGAFTMVTGKTGDLCSDGRP